MFKNFTLASIFSIIIIGLFVGVIFVYADWTAPLSSPPTCVAGNPGCDAPINVSDTLQTKLGPLNIVNGNIALNDSGIYTLGSLIIGGNAAIYGSLRADDGIYTPGSLIIRGNAAIDGSLRVSGRDVCLGDGTNCLATEIPQPCNDGYIRVGAWCLDKDGEFLLLRGAGGYESSYTSTNTINGAKAVIIRSVVYGMDTGSKISADFISACALPGSSLSTINCNGAGAFAGAALAKTIHHSVNSNSDFILTGNDSGIIKTRCGVGNIKGGAAGCTWYLEGYIN